LIVFSSTQRASSNGLPVSKNDTPRPARLQWPKWAPFRLLPSGRKRQ
jgi:hypothetical protein